MCNNNTAKLILAYLWVTIIFALLHGFTIWFLLKRAGLIFSLFYFLLALLKLFTIFAVIYGCIVEVESSDTII
jgi:hypothetical protein